MSVTIRPCVGKDNIWEVDIRVLLPDGTNLRERREAPVPGKSAALRWAQDRERVLVRDGKPKRERVHKEVPTLRDFGPRFIDGHVRANRHKPSGVAGNESIIRRHLVGRLGSKRLNEITQRTCSS